eukprot:gb/GECG01013934.1/.p1 GENE.gb/GECG01013934.1/~~gb/GECG01013934.1/.p1  ORF type:complete len:279 (+),score=25.53 gb/GECG01013934.1/:1-837(+)
MSESKGIASSEARGAISEAPLEVDLHSTETFSDTFSSGPVFTQTSTHNVARRSSETGPSFDHITGKDGEFGPGLSVSTLQNSARQPLLDRKKPTRGAGAYDGTGITGPTRETVGPQSQLRYRSFSAAPLVEHDSRVPSSRNPMGRLFDMIHRVSYLSRQNAPNQETTFIEEQQDEDTLGYSRTLPHAYTGGLASREKMHEHEKKMMGGFESLDYDVPQNKLYREEHYRIDNTINRNVNVARWILFGLIGKKKGHASSKLVIPEWSKMRPYPQVSSLGH